jgi:Flp pilus assembly protein TadD
MAYLAKGLLEEALSSVQMAITLQDNSGPSNDLAWVYARSGREGEARQILETAQPLADQGEYPARGIASIHAALDEKDEAFAWFEKSIDERESRVVYLQMDRRLDSLHDAPRWTDLLRRINLVP